MTFRQQTPFVPPATEPTSRRSLLRWGGAAAVGLAAAGSLPRITFGQDATPVGTPAAGMPVAGPGGSEIIPSPIDGVPDVYLSSPEPFTSYDGVPGRGGTVRALMISYSPPPPGRDNNPYWQELERRLGVRWEIDLVPQPQYGEITSTRLAGGDLPDLFYLNPEQGATQLYQAMAQGAFLDLGPYVTGDSLQQYPNLATFPQSSWDNARFQGIQYGVPKVQPSFGNLGFYRTDWAETVGLANPQGPEQIAQLLQGYTSGDPDGNGNPDTWGAGRFESGWKCWDNAVSAQMHRVPFNWRLEADGTLTNQIETEEYRQLIQYLRDLFAAGTFHPDAASMTFSAAQDAFIAGVTGHHYEGFTSLFGVGNVTYRMQQSNPAARTGYFVPVGADGQPGVVYNGTGHFGYVGIPASLEGDDERIMELLRILDYLAAPFGSEEATFLANGIEGIHSDRNADGNLIINDVGRTEKSDLPGIMNGLPVLFYPEEPETGIVVQQGGIAAKELGVDDPSLGLYSPTNVENGPALSQLGTDRITAIVTGRDDFSALDDAIQQWRDRAGDQIRSEFEEALAQQG